MYKCLKCGEKIPIKQLEKISCPVCGHRILIKERPKEIKEVDAN
jgi:DNA-directed RNA polymerase subunit P